MADNEIKLPDLDKIIREMPWHPWGVASTKEIAYDFAARAIAADRAARPVADDWKQAVLDECIVMHLSVDEANPRQAVKQMIAFAIEIDRNPAVSDRPVADAGEAVAWVTPLRYGSKVTFHKPTKPEEWDDDEPWFCRALVYADRAPSARTLTPEHCRLIETAAQILERKSHEYLAGELRALLASSGAPAEAPSVRDAALEEAAEIFDAPVRAEMLNSDVAAIIRERKSKADRAARTLKPSQIAWLCDARDMARTEGRKDLYEALKEIIDVCKPATMQALAASAPAEAPSARVVPWQERLPADHVPTPLEKSKAKDAEIAEWRALQGKPGAAKGGNHG